MTKADEIRLAGDRRERSVTKRWCFESSNNAADEVPTRPSRLPVPDTMLRPLRIAWENVHVDLVRALNAEKPRQFKVFTLNWRVGDDQRDGRTQAVA